MTPTLTPSTHAARLSGLLLTLLLVAPWSTHAAQPTLAATLVDPEQKAKQQTATVQVTVDGIRLVDPDSVDARATTGEGHLHYRVDDGPVIATTAAKLSFHALASGRHAIVVTLVGNDHKPLGSEKTIAIAIP